jgi:ABC-type branched-subunit amino acid transport system permease subunit
MAIIALCGLLNGWTAEQEDKALGRTMSFVVFAPVTLIVAALVAVLFGIVLFSAFGWLASIPTWAAVIIVLLVLIYLKK